MNSPYSLFRYSGNKGKLLAHLPVSKSATIWEPFLGSGAYGLNSTASTVVGYDVNPDIITLWQFLQSTTPERLRALKEVADENKDSKADIRNLGLSPGELVYLKVNVCSVMTGQLSSWKLYPQHHLPVEKTAAALLKAHKVQATLGSYLTMPVDRIQPEDTVFIDPPYLGTSGNYKASGKVFDGLHPTSLTEWIKALPPCHVLFTYGSDARDTFPDFDWEVACTRKVPNLRRGGTVERRELFCVLNNGGLPSFLPPPSRVAAPLESDLTWDW